MPSIIPSPGSPGSPNVFATIPLNQNISLGAGQRLYTTAPMFALFDHTVTLGTTYFTLANAGTMWITSTGIARLLYPWNFDAITNSGLMVAYSSGGDASYVVTVNSTWQGGLNNSGRMFAISTAGDAATIVDYSPGAVITNSGLIAAQGAIDVAAITRYNGGQVVNTATGQILAEGRDVYAIWLVHGDAAGGVDLDNAGLIRASSIDPAHASVGVLIASLGTTTIHNTGTITADYAILIDGTTYGGVHRVLNDATGHINGDIVLERGNDYVENAGQIVGDVVMGLDNDTIVNSGQIVGLAAMGWGEDHFTGGGSADAVIGDRGDDTLNGGGANDLLLGGRGDDAIAGGAGNDGLYGEFGNDVITTQGGDRVAAGVGDDTVVLGDLAFADVDGGGGHDTLQLPNVARVLDLQAAIATGRLHSFETIALPGAQELVVRAADIAALTGGAQQLMVETTAASRIDLVGAWVASAPVAIDGVVYANYTQGAASVLVSGTGTVAIMDTAPAGASGLDAVAAGAVAPLPGSTAGANLTGSVTNMGPSMEGPDIIEADEIWTSNVGGGTGGWELVNYGQVISSGNGVTGARAMGVMIANYGAISATVTGDGADLASNISRYNIYGVTNCIQTFMSNAIAARSFDENHGTISASSEASIAVASNGGGGVNFGTLSATSSQFVAVGVRGGGGFINAGDINVTGQFEAFGVVSGGLALTNSGHITVNAVGSGAHSIGVYVYYATGTQHLTNSGTISAEIAVRTEQMVNGNALVLDNSGEIHGRIELNLQTNGVGARQDVVMNSGLIDGQIHLGGERDLYLGGLGSQLQGVFGEAGMDLLVGGVGGETLNGGADADALAGGGGADMLAGGAGGDVFVYTAAGDSTGSAFDTIVDFETGLDRIDLTALAPSSVALDFADGVTTLSANTAGGLLVVHVSGVVSASDVMTLAQATINGTTGADLLIASGGGCTVLGGDGDDLLVGSASNDILNGGVGFDTMVGGAGDDVYYAEYAEEDMRELAGGGVDTIILNAVYPALYYMPDNIENLTALGSYANVVGNDLANFIVGNANDGEIDGGAGADTMIGGAGSDRYHVDNALDVVIEDANAAGIDVIISSISYTLSENVENFTLADGAGAINAMGNDLANLISGNEAVNIIHALGGADTISAGAGADFLYGEDGNDSLYGQSGDDVIDGGAGNDVVWGDVGADDISGGDGDDILYATSTLWYDASYNIWRSHIPDDAAADSMHGGAGNDVIHAGLGNDFIDGGAGFDTANYFIASTAATWSRNGAVWTVSSADGTDTVTGVEVLHFTDRDVNLYHPFQTFSGDVTSDILFRSTSGAVVSWNVAGTTLSSSAYLASVAPAQWAALGTGDFDGDGRDDILWRNTGNGGVYSWQMNGAAIASVGAIASLGAEWSFLGAGDFNGDGRDDLAWRNSNSGTVYSWDMSGAATIGSAGALASLGAEWSLQGIGDFNGDGRDDFLWRNASGATYIWSMNDRAISVSATSAQAGADWHVEGVGDFNGDGRDDILWRNDNGSIATWAMNGSTLSQAGFIAQVGPEWHIMQVGDYNGDGRDDILWQNNNGTVYAWMLNGSTLLQAGAIASVGPEWGII